MAPPYVADEWNKNAQRTISNVKKRLVKLDREFDVAAASSNAVNITIEERIWKQCGLWNIRLTVK